MNILSKLSGSTDKPQDQNPDHNNTSASDVMSRAKLVADAAKSSFNSGGEAVDKGKVAGATADLLGTASDYGKLDETKGVGKYVDQAEDYLHKYEKSHSVSHGTDAADPKPAEPPKKESSGEKEEGGSGFGGYLKGAEGFLKK